MGRVLFAGYHAARDAGLLYPSPDLRYALTTGAALDQEDDGDAVNVADLTWDEFDGVGYARYDPDHTTAYDATTQLWRAIPDAGAGDEFGATVAAGGGGAPTGLLEILHIDGTDANDYVIAWSDEGTFADGNGGGMSFTFPANGTLTSGPA